MTADTASLQERIAEELYYDQHPEGRHRSEWPTAVYPDDIYEYRDLAAAVLPIIAAEVQAASEKAWGEGVAAWRDYESGLDPRLGHPRRDTPLNPYRATETGDRT